MIDRGDLNINRGYLGVPGTGKSYLAVKELIETQQRYNCYALLHDAQMCTPKFPEIRRYETIDAAKAMLAKDPKGVHAIGCLDAVEVVNLGKQIANKSFTPNKGERGVPCLIGIDEMVSFSDGSAYRLGPVLRDALTRRRWLNVGIFWTCQSPQLCHYSLLSLSTEITLFRITDERAHDSLRKIGVDEKVISQLRTLPDRKFIKVKIG